MPDPGVYTNIKVPEETRDRAREMKSDLQEKTETNLTWNSFLKGLMEVFSKKKKGLEKVQDQDTCPVCGGDL